MSTKPPPPVPLLDAIKKAETENKLPGVSTEDRRRKVAEYLEC